MAAYKEQDTNLGFVRLGRAKNKSPAAVQITAEQILREAREMRDSESRPPKQQMIDSTEVADYRFLKRKEFEDRARGNASIWAKYADWEACQKDFRRARSVWERALQVDYTNHTFWIKYAEMEMKNRFVNHARNVWDRAVTLLPRIDQLWYKYIHMEQMVGNFGGARQIFEKWMKWQPGEHGWLSYIKFEVKCNEVERARGIYERFVECQCPGVRAWIGYAKFEMKMGEVARARQCYERAVALLGCDEEAELLFVAFAEFEERLNEFERARAIYKLALDHIPDANGELCRRRSLEFEKRRKRRFQNVDADDDLREERKDRDAEYNKCTAFAEESQTPKLLILQRALQWKKKQRTVQT